MNDTRTLSKEELDAIRSFQRHWGYTDNSDMQRSLVSMLSDMNTPTDTLIDRVVREWDLIGPDYRGIQAHLHNLFIVRLNAIEPFIPKPAEQDKRVIRMFYGPMGDVWISYIISEMPETYSEVSRGLVTSIYDRAADDTALYVRVALHFTRDEAVDNVDSYRVMYAEMVQAGEIVLYEYELDQM